MILNVIFKKKHVSFAFKPLVSEVLYVLVIDVILIIMKMMMVMMMIKMA